MQPDAVIFDWGGTLTQWHDIDFHAESLALAHAVIGVASTPPHVHAEALHRANQVIWGRSRDHQQSSTVADLFSAAGLDHDPELLSHYREFWEPHTSTDAQVGPLFRTLHERGIRVGVLSNTVWPASRHEDSSPATACSTSSTVPSTPARSRGPSPLPRRSGPRWRGSEVTDPSRCVFVGDRLFDDIWGARNAGLKAIHVPHSDIPAEQVGHSEGEPHAVAHGLGRDPGAARPALASYELVPPAHASYDVRGWTPPHGARRAGSRCTRGGAG